MTTVCNGLAAGREPGADAVRIVAEIFALLVTGQMRETKGVPRKAMTTSRTTSGSSPEKTACLIAASGRFGGTFSGATDRIEQLGRLGGIVGTVFQISDDIIDIEADPTNPESCPAPTCARGSTPSRSVRAAGAGPHADRLRDLLKAPIADDDTLAEALMLLRASGGIAAAKKTVLQYAEQARDELDGLPTARTPGPGFVGGLHRQPPRLSESGTREPRQTLVCRRPVLGGSR